MHDSMMIADVGGIENVSGRRIATPLAPPRPGRTPISTPRRMPTSMKSRFWNVSATAKPCIRLLISSTRTLRWLDVATLVFRRERYRSKTQQVLDWSLGQGDEEPHFEIGR